MDGKQLFSDDRVTRLAVCGILGAALVAAAEQYCPGKDIPLWDRYGPWIVQNRVQAIAAAAGALYLISLVLRPEETKQQDKNDGFVPCP